MLDSIDIAQPKWKELTDLESAKGLFVVFKKFILFSFKVCFHL